MNDPRLFKGRSTRLNANMNRRSVLRLTAAGTGLVVASRYFATPVLAEVPPLEEKDTYTVGFAQTGLNNPWRLANSKSMQDEAARLGYTLIETNANEDTAKQIADVDSLIAQGVDILIFPPREAQALAPSVIKAKNAGIPVILTDRAVDDAIAKPGEDYITFIGSDFVDQGRRAAECWSRRQGARRKSSSFRERPGRIRLSTARRGSRIIWPEHSMGRRRRKASTREWRSSPRKRLTSSAISAAK